MLKYVTDIINDIYVNEEVIKEKKYHSNLDKKIIIDINNVITNYLGMGGALTESTAYNYGLLSKKNKDNFIKDCFSKDGLNYNYARISIGSCDFSLSYYSYAKNKDLSDFSISNDKKYIIPLIKDIKNEKDISIIASPWSPPRMYKFIKTLRFGTKLKKKYYNSYSDYLIKFIDSYNQEMINVDYLTIQNEPLARQKWESCKYNLSEQKNFIYNHLLYKLKNTKLLLFDHNKDNLYNITKFLYQKDNRIAGVAFHNYTGSHFDEIKRIRDEYPNLMLINTEGCTGFSLYDKNEWIKDAEYYLNDIIGDFNHGANAYLDWNILLNREGGPCHVKNPVKSILVLDGNDYIKTPIYYYIYHISHFVDKNMKIIKYDSYIKNLDILVMKSADKIVIIIMNRNNVAYGFNLVLGDKYITDYINSHSVITYINYFDKKLAIKDKI